MWWILFRIKKGYIFSYQDEGLLPIAIVPNANRTLGVRSYGIYVTNGSHAEKRSSCAWAYEKSIKISFYPFQERGLPLTGWRDSIDRQIGPADYARTRGGEAPVHECLSPSLWNGLYLTLYIRNVQVRSAECDSGHTQATLLTHSHGRTFVTRLWTMALIGPGELLIAGARRIWLSIASFAERTFLISMVFRQLAWVLNQTQSFQRALRTRACARVWITRPCESVEPCKRMRKYSS